jgi:RNA-binding protein YlmH
MDLKQKIFDIYFKSGDDKLIAAKIIDKYNFTVKNRLSAATAFLTPAEQSLALKFLPLLKEAEYRFLGGADDGRRILCFFPEYAGIAAGEEFLCSVKIKCKESLTHRDYLGSLMGLGIRRETIGDIIVQDDGCFAAVLSEIAPFIKSELKKVGRAAVSEIEILPIASVDFKTQKLSEKRSTVSSLRLDAVISAGFNISRSLSTDYIRAKKVSVNYIERSKPDFTVKDGDRISVSGLGRIIVGFDGKTTKRNRLSVTIKK